MPTSMIASGICTGGLKALNCPLAAIATVATIVFSKMNDKFPLWYYQPKVVSLYIYTLEV